MRDGAFFIYFLILLRSLGVLAATSEPNAVANEDAYVHNAEEGSMPSPSIAEPEIADVLINSDVNSFDFVSHLSSTRFLYSNVTLVYSNFDAYIASTPKSEAEKATYVRIARVLGQIKTNMVIFTSVANAPILRVLRGDLPTLFIAFTKRSAIPLFNDTEALFNITGEGYLTSIAKPWFLDQAAKNNLFKSKYFIYLDLELFPEDSSDYHLRHWPSSSRIDLLLTNRSGIESDTVFMSAIDTTTSCLVADETTGDCKQYFVICSGVFGGTATAIAKHYYAYAVIVNHFYKQKTLFQDDNHVLQQMLGAMPSNYLVVHPTSELYVNSDACGSNIHPLYLLLADPVELSTDCASALTL